MKQDKLEQFIIDHRTEFDILEPPPGLWNIPQTKPGRKSSYKLLLRLSGVAVAASIIVALTLHFHDSLVPIPHGYSAKSLATDQNNSIPHREVFIEKEADDTRKISIKKENLQKRPKAGPKKKAIYPLLNEAELYYTSLINIKENEIYRLAGNNSVVRKEMSIELGELDKAMTDLKKDLNDNIDNTRVVEALIQNYRLKLEILEDLLNEIKLKESQENTESHENRIDL